MTQEYKLFVLEKQGHVLATHKLNLPALLAADSSTPSCCKIAPPLGMRQGCLHRHETGMASVSTFELESMPAHTQRLACPNTKYVT